ncbi:LCP family protein [Streptomyces sp. NPDC052042]|uniref:LCP family protein n=1 Tax=Streptomyces sp. NPDC052042 TaxID=3365683 RepID=UPI0037D14A0B
MTDSRQASRRRARATTARGRRRRRGRGRTLLAAAVSLLVLGTAGAGWVYTRLNGSINTFSADGVSDDRPPASTKGSNVLVIGSDARTSGNSALGGGDANDVGRSDTAFLLHTYADQKHAVAVSIPRDTLVDIPPCKLPDGTWSKPQSGAMFNAAYSVGETPKGNPACTQNTVEKLTGLRVDHTIVVDFKGFAAMTEAVGGVQVCLPQDVYQRDLNPNRSTRGKKIFAKGPQKVSGQRALDYVRIRHGIGDGSDIGRIKRQQAFMASLLKQIKSDGLTPSKLLPLADAATNSMTVDPGLGSADKLVAFAMSMKDIDLHNTKFVTVPWKYQGARVAIVHPDADALWAALRADRTLDGKDAGGERKGGTAASPSAGAGASDSGGGATGSEARVSGAGVSVAVHNGTTVTGLAARAAEVLREHSFTVTDATTSAVRDQATTVIRYGPGEEERAGKAARLFPGAELAPVATPGITVLLGRDYADRPDASASPPSTDVPAQVAEEARSADDNPCSDLSYG